MICAVGRACRVCARREVSEHEGSGMSETDVLQRQLEQLQSELAFQGDTLQALNDALAVQQQELLTMRRQLELMQQRLREALPAREPGSTQEPPPPHY